MVPRARDRPVIPSEDVHRKLHPKQALSYALHLRVEPCIRLQGLPWGTGGMTMSFAIRFGGILVVLVCVTGAGAAAQYRQTRQGFWAGFGVGYGSANIACDSCISGPRVGGYTAWVKAGGTLSP